MSKNPSVLFIPRKYPPISGGMEKYSEDLYESLVESGCSVELLANRKGNKSLPMFLIQVIIKLISENRRYTHIHLGDGVLSPLAVMFAWWSSARWSVTMHGLDVTYRMWLYRTFWPKMWGSFDMIVAVSQHTRQEILNRGVTVPIEVIPNGIRLRGDEVLDVSRCESSTSEVVLLSVGRLVRRKGVAEFVRNVMPLLPQNYVFRIAGAGSMLEEIENAITESHLEQRVTLLGRISDEEKASLWNRSDLFIMPNIEVPGDMEGFGISVIEASIHGLPVVARGIEGLKDAVIPGQTGVTVSNGSPEEYISAIETALKLSRETVSQVTIENFSWKELVKEYYNKVFI